MKPALVLLILAACVSRAQSPHRLGAAGGFPQMISLTYQYTPVEYTTLEVYAGSMVLNATAGGRVILSRTENGLSPRVFAGYSFFDQWYGDNSQSPMGTTGYLWYGTGLGYNFPFGVALFADLGWLRGGDPEKGLGLQAGGGNMAISGGLLISL